MTVPMLWSYSPFQIAQSDYQGVSFVFRGAKSSGLGALIEIAIQSEFCLVEMGPVLRQSRLFHNGATGLLCSQSIVFVPAVIS